MKTWVTWKELHFSLGQYRKIQLNLAPKLPISKEGHLFFKNTLRSSILKFKDDPREFQSGFPPLKSFPI